MTEQIPLMSSTESDSGRRRQTSGAAPLRLGCSSRKWERASSYMFWIKPLLLITPSFLCYSPIHEILLKLGMLFTLLVKAGHLLPTSKRKLTGVEVYTVVIMGSGETSSLLFWLFSIFIARLLNVKCRKSPKSKDQSPDLSQGVQLPFAFHCPQSCIS